MIDRNKLLASGISVAEMLQEVGYITEKRKGELVYRINTGDKAAYSELQVLLIVMANDLGRI